MRNDMGHCRICGDLARLTDEHLIPEAAGNSGRLRAMSVHTLGYRTPGLKFGNGLVRRSLCGRCNNLGGNSYVKPFVRMTAQAAGYHSAASRSDVAIVSLEITPLEVIKQVGVMTLAMADPCVLSLPGFTNLRHFVLSPRAQGHLWGFRLYAYLNYGPPALDGCHYPYNTKDGRGGLIHCHVAHTPLGYIVTSDDDRSTEWARSLRLADITRYSTRPAGVECVVHLTLPCLKSPFAPRGGSNG